jgi:drug/metabolite transporter (DMT)-like permease
MTWIIAMRVLLSVSANAVQKRLLLNHAQISHAWIITYLLMLLPAVALAAWQPAAQGTFWFDIACGGAIDALGNLAMVAALRLTDVSVFGPLNALRPILALIFGWFFLGENPTAFGLLGVAITVVGGVVLLSDPNPQTSRSWKELLTPLFFRITGLSLGVFGAVFLKRASSQASAEMTVAGWIISGLVVLALAALVHRPAELKTIPQSAQLHRNWLLLHAAVFLGMQWLTIRIFQETLLAYSFVFFQLGMVLQVFVGRLFFKERAFLRRLFASLIMASGSIIILWKG